MAKKNSKVAKSEVELKDMHDADLFGRLVSNGIEFFETAISDLEKRPKFSVINFCSGLEILLKARLLREHWSLIIKKPEDATLMRFQSGDFHSVTMDETIKRLRNIGGDNFTPQEEKCFEELREHRNKLVHFYHEAYSQKASSKLLEEIATEQCKAWFYLHRKVVSVWSQWFVKHQEAIQKLDTKLQGLRPYLRGKYEAIKPSIDEDLRAGVEHTACSSCGFPAAEIREKVEPCFQSTCKVCGSKESFLRVPCPKCSQVSDIEDLASAFCMNEECNEDITLDDVMQRYGPQRSRDPKDDLPAEYYCATCEYSNSSVILLGDKYFCLWCKEWFDRVEQCEWCGTELGGFQPDGSYLYGCFLCERSAREHFDRM